MFYYRNVDLILYKGLFLKKFLLMVLFTFGCRNEHEPFTLKGGGLFHLSYGAILTGSTLNK